MRVPAGHVLKSSDVDTLAEQGFEVSQRHGWMQNVDVKNVHRAVSVKQIQSECAKWPVDVEIKLIKSIIDNWRQT